MKKLTCKTGDKFGYWTVIDNTSISKNGHTYVTVQCKCGKIQELCLYDLIHNRALGCRNCRARDRSVPIKINDVYKQWVVINGPNISKHQSILWQVRCLCCGITVRWIQGNELVNKSKCFCCQKCASKKMIKRVTKNRGRIGDLGKTQYTRLKKSAQVRNIEFNVTLKDLWDLFVLQQSKCALTGDRLNNIKEASLDRKDSKIGYIKNNIQWTTKQANISKHILSQDDFIHFCQKVINYANQQPSQENPQ